MHLKFHNAVVMAFFLQRSTNFTNWIYLIFRNIERVLFTLIKARIKIFCLLIFKPFYYLFDEIDPKVLTIRFYIIENLPWPQLLEQLFNIPVFSIFYSLYTHLLFTPRQATIWPTLVCVDLRIYLPVTQIRIFLSNIVIVNNLSLSKL